MDGPFEGMLAVNDISQKAPEMTSEPKTQFGALIHPVTKDYIRWRQHEDDAEPLLAVRDCYTFMGIKRVDVPSYSHIRAVVRTVRTMRIWKEYYPHSGWENLSVVPHPAVAELIETLPACLALGISGGLERMVHFTHSQPFVGFFDNGEKGTAQTLTTEANVV